MSTRATIEFVDEIHTKACVYKHCDGYPSGIAQALTNALPLAWELPRFEADEFAAAFIAGNKTSGGNLRVIQNPKKYDRAFHYRVSFDNGSLTIKVWAIDFDDKLKLKGTYTLATLADAE